MRLRQLRRLGRAERGNWEACAWRPAPLIATSKLDLARECGHETHLLQCGAV